MINHLKLIIFLMLALFINCDKNNLEKSVPLKCHVGGTMQPIMKHIAKLYEKETGVKVEINSAGSGELLAHIKSTGNGDVYVSHDPFIDILMNKWKLGEDGWHIANIEPVIVVQKGNPKNIKTLDDFKREDVKVILTDYKLSSLGQMLPTIFKKAGIDFDELNKTKKIITNKSGGYSANYVKMGNADVAIVWNAVWKLREDALDFINIKNCLPQPYIDAITSASGVKHKLMPMRVTVASLKCSKRPEDAKKFSEYIASEKINKVIRDYNYSMVETKKIYEKGNVVESNDDKRLKLFVAAGLRKAIVQLIAEFKKVSGIEVEPDFGGSGVILSRAIETKNADLFMPADTWYVDKLKQRTDKVVSQANVSYFIPVIIVKKGNPKKIKVLNDLFRKDVKVGFGNVKSCQIGNLTAKLLEKNGLDIKDKSHKSSTTVNELGVWVKMNNVDAAIVWDATAKNLKDDVDAISIPVNKNIISNVAISVLKTSKKKSAANSFVEFITGTEGEEIFNENGFITNISSLN